MDATLLSNLEMNETEAINSQDTRMTACVALKKGKNWMKDKKAPRGRCAVNKEK
jgi:hypothetical protein